MISFTAEQVFLITGASSGIGEAIALQCNALGGTVIANGRNRERLESNKLKATAPERFHIEQRDLTKEIESLPLWVKSLREKYGKLHGLVHAAGVSLTASLREYEFTTALKLFAIHVHVPLLLAKGFSDRRNNIGKGASIVFIASASAVVPVRGMVVYSSAKAAIIAAARSMSKELVGHGIRVNCISPGLVKTHMGDEYANTLGEQNFATIVGLYPLGIGIPDDIASPAMFLLSHASSWMTGQNLYVAGGWE